MSSYDLILYYRQLCPSCARVKKTLKSLGVEAELRSVLLSRRNRAELLQIAGRVDVPCLVAAGMVVRDEDEIKKYLHLRYGA